MTATTGVAASEKSISRLRVPEESDLPPVLQRFFDSYRRDEGFVPNYFRAFALNADNLARLNGYQGQLLDESRGYLPIREREVIALVVSSENRCSYCHVFHVDSLGKVLKDKGKAERIALDYRKEELTPRERALADLAVTITHRPRDLHDDDIDRLRELGLDDHQILEAIELAALINCTNRVCISLGVPVDREFFD